MKRPAIFFDRDNTLIRNDGYLGDPAGVVLVDGAADAVARLRSFGYAIVTFSNQSGVGRGMFTEDAVRAVNAKMDELLVQQNAGAIIDAHEFCPYHPDATVEAYRQDSDLRKPKPGMILKAAEEMGLNLSQSWVIGDAPRDIEAGRAAGCKTILFHDSKLPPSEAAREAAIGEPDYAVTSLRRAVEVVARQTPGAMPEPSAPAPAAKPQAADSETSPAPQVNDDEAAVSRKIEPTSHQRASSSSVIRAAVEARRSTATSPAPTQTTGTVQNARLDIIAQQILDELRRHRHVAEGDFSVSKLLAGIMQVLAGAILFLSFLYRSEPATMQPIMLLAIFLQVFTVALLIMGQQKQ